MYVLDVQHFEFRITNLQVSVRRGVGSSEHSLPLDVVFHLIFIEVYIQK